MSFRMVLLGCLLACFAVHEKTDAFTFSTGGGGRLRRTARQRGRNVCIHRATNNDGEGLLRGVDITKDKYYASDLAMDSMKDLEWLQKPGLAWEAATKDAKLKRTSPEEYIKTCKEAALAFQVSDTVLIREDFVAFLESAVDTKAFAMLIGAKSVGKSLVLKDFVKWQNAGGKALALYVSCRQASGKPLVVPMKEALGRYLLEHPEVLGSTVDPLLVDSMTNSVRPFAKLMNIFGGSEEKASESELTGSEQFQSSGEMFRILVGLDDLSDKEVLEAFMTLAERENKTPVLVIDESDLCLGLGYTDGSIKSRVKRWSVKSSPVLSALVDATKQDKRLTAILASSEYNYPYMLEDNGLNPEDISIKLFAGEIRPSAMWELLTSAKYAEPAGEREVGDMMVGMGPNLARLFMAAYGGHFLRMIKAMTLFSTTKEEFLMADGLSTINSQVWKCLKIGNNSGEFGMESLLKKMALRGFAPLDAYDNTNAECISLNDVGGVVEKGKVIVGLPRKVWQSTSADYALVPSSLSARFVIAKQLLLWREKEEDRKQKDEQEKRKKDEQEKKKDEQERKEEEEAKKTGKEAVQEAVRAAVQAVQEAVDAVEEAKGEEVGEAVEKEKEVLRKKQWWKLWQRRER